MTLHQLHTISQALANEVLDGVETVVHDEGYTIRLTADQLSTLEDCINIAREAEEATSAPYRQRAFIEACKALREAIDEQTVELWKARNPRN